MSEQRFSISLATLPIVLITGLSLVLCWQLRQLLLIVMIAVVVAASLSPVVNRFDRLGLPRWLAVLTTYIGLVSIIVGVGLVIGPSVSQQIERLIRQLPTFADILRATIEYWALRLSNAPPELIRQFFDLQSLTGWLIGSSQQLLLRSYGITRGILGGVFSIILSILISGYMVADSQTLLRSLVQLFPTPWDDRLAAQVVPMANRMGGYIRGRLLVSLILGVATTLGLSFLGMGEFALGLGAIAGVTNLIPFIGPILGSIPALIVALSLGGWTVLWVLILFVIIQNVETYVLDPLLVGSSVGVHPLYQLLSVLGGVQVLGIIGALIVPPWFAGVAVLVENLYLRPKLLAERRHSRLSSLPPPRRRRDRSHPTLSIRARGSVP
ncbi:AI-2E family transporter [Prochlorothrix hollandica]|uniref:AI-2E family transporter n=1 Tax=Prochlorothrix hollandica TaxID=1223 RepID=UPI0033405D6F